MAGTNRIEAVRAGEAIALIVLAAGMMPCPASAQRNDSALRVTGPEVLVAAPDDSTGVFGNIAPNNAHAHSNGKRYPLVIGEVDCATGLLRRRTITSVADRRPDQHEGIQFSNFSCLEDRKTGEIVIVVPHFYPSGRWMSGQLCRYRVQVPGIGR